jgi:Ca2+/H+ antiporter, TMEM165/GDT1 family
MDLKLLISTFFAIFLAELGDKTQIATLSLAAGTSSRWSVFLGACLALIATSALAVLGGDLAARLVSPVWLRRTAGAVFIVLGVVYVVTAKSAA